MAHRLEILLGLKSPPLAVTFCDEPPRGVPRVQQTGPAGCSYWKLAAQGQVFYTTAEDHHNCPIGAYTHGIELPPERNNELDEMIGIMCELDYLKKEEVPRIPRRTERFGVAVYAPWSQTPCKPDIIMVQGDAKQIMLLSEAMHAEEVGDRGEAMGRPTCAIIPATLHSGRATISFGCIGNRVYNELDDDQLYASLPAEKSHDVVERLEKIVHANRELERFHLKRMLPNT